MAGHSHWANIKRTKGVADARRGQLFSKLAREVSMAAKLGGGDPNFNPRLRRAVSAARAESMPADNIERAIKKGTGELEGAAALEEIVYEGYGPGGVAMVVEATTDNKNRSAAEIRSIFAKNGGNLAGAGSVAWMFQRRGLVVVGVADEDAVLEATLEAGAEDVRAAEGQVEVIAPGDKLDLVVKAVEAAKLPVSAARFTYLPQNTTPVTDEETAAKVLHLYEALDDHDDVLNVYANFEMAPDLLAKVTA
ncbi:MAG: YebC/PmpR family DNA-binding transcriptional regulator [Verrucomicrobium sp.]|nr:YebC/PmpR family DNA-binding transcriptional regulator [Verrucomicrobium sp.]